MSTMSGVFVEFALHIFFPAFFKMFYSSKILLSIAFMFCLRWLRVGNPHVVLAVKFNRKKRKKEKTRGVTCNIWHFLQSLQIGESVIHSYKNIQSFFSCLTILLIVTERQRGVWLTSKIDIFNVDFCVLVKRQSLLLSCYLKCLVIAHL